MNLLPVVTDGENETAIQLFMVVEGREAMVVERSHTMISTHQHASSHISTLPTTRTHNTHNAHAVHNRLRTKPKHTTHAHHNTTTNTQRTKLRQVSSMRSEFLEVFSFFIG